MDEFNTLEELKKRVSPAIDTKLKELKANYYYDVTEEDIWEYLKIKWKKKNNLTLYDIVNDIINLDNEEILDFSIRSGNNDKD